MDYGQWHGGGMGRERNTDRKYNAIQQNIWHRGWFQALDGDSQRVYLYLLNHPHMTMLGCFVLSIGMLTEDLRISTRAANKAINYFSDKNYIVFCRVSRLCYVREHFTCNPISSGNVALCAQKVLEDLPKSAILLAVAGDILAHPVTKRQRGEERAKYEALVLKLQQHSGGWLPGREPLALPLEVEKDANKTAKSGTPPPPPPPVLPVAGGGGRTWGEDVPQVVGEGVGDSAPAPAYISKHTTGEDTQLPDISGATGSSPPWPLLSLFSDEARRYNERPVVSSTYPAATLQAAESNLADLLATGERLERPPEDAVAEVVRRLRRTKNLADLRNATCPAVVIGKVAGWVWKDWAEELSEKEVAGGASGKYEHLEQA
jgi:hypothetical protein